MECDKIQGHLSAYIDNALSPAEKGSIDSHLKSCPKCRKSLADLEMTINSIKRLGEIIPPPWLTQKIMTRVKAESEPAKKNLWQKLFYPLHIKLPIEAVGFFLIALTALYIFKSMEPELKTVVAPPEETVSEYTSKGKESILPKKSKKPSETPALTSSKEDKTAAAPPLPQKSSPLTAPLSEQPVYDQETVREEHAMERMAPEKNMLMKTAPAPAGLSAPTESKQEHAPQAAGKIISGLQEKEDISISFKADRPDKAESDIKEILSDLGGRVVKEETTSDTLIIIIQLGSDKLRPLMQKLKMLGYIKEKTPTPMSDKDQVLIKITVSKP